MIKMFEHDMVKLSLLKMNVDRKHVFYTRENSEFMIFCLHVK